MTATNHMLTGAVVAISIQQPWLVVPLAFISHFVLDSLPHFGINESDASIRNKDLRFLYILAMDVVLAIAFLIYVPLVLHHAVAWWVVLVGMLAAWIPDAVWVRHFMHHLRGNVHHKKSRLSRFHQRIQWFERPPGLIVEVAWFSAMSVFLGLSIR